MELMDVTVLKAETPDAIWVTGINERGTLLKEKSQKATAAHGNQLMQSINAYLDKQTTAQFTAVVPKVGRVYAAKHPEAKRWERVKVESIFSNGKRVQARCVFIDGTDCLTIPAAGLRPLPLNYEEAEPLSQLCKLHGIQPMSYLTHCLDNETNLRPSETWDIGAIRWLQQQLRDKQVNLKLMEERGHLWSIQLSVLSGDRWCVINDEMVRLGYAAYSASSIKQTDKTVLQRVLEFTSESSSKEISKDEHVNDGNILPTSSKQRVPVASQNVKPASCGRGSLAAHLAAEIGGSQQKHPPGGLMTEHHLPSAVKHITAPTVPSDTSLAENAAMIASIMEWMPGRSRSQRQNDYGGGSSGDAFPLDLLSHKPCIMTGKAAADLMLSRVLTRGEMLPKPVVNMQESFFPDCLKQFWSKWGCTTVHPIEAFAWPAVMRGLPIMAVSPVIPAENETLSHEILSYLFPIATMMMNLDAYKNLPNGNGPLTVVLACSWKKAQLIYRHAQLVFDCWPQRQQGTRCRLLYGDKQDEDNHSIPLMNGCEVLCATPHSLIRMLDRGYTNLLRTCHIIFDDADVLANEFEEQLSKILGIFSKVMETQRAIVVPRQLITFSNRWTPIMHAFFSRRMLSPAILIASKFEAAVFGGVRQVVRVGERSQMVNHLMSIIESSTIPDIKTLIFVNNDEEAKVVSDVLISTSLYVIVATNGMEGDELDEQLREWHAPHSSNSQPVMVLTDDVLAYFEQRKPIRDAALLVHFDLPADKKKFSERLYCMATNYAKDFEHRHEAHCASHIICTSASTVHAPALVQLLERLNEKVPAALMDMTEQSFHASEQEKAKDLCDRMKAYGKCRGKVTCDGRHVVSSSLDAPCSGLPVSGLLKVKVLTVKNAATFYGRLLKHREGNVVRDLTNRQFELACDMQQFYAKKKNKAHCYFEKIKPDDVYAFEESNGLFSRAKVCRVKYEASGLATMVAIIIVDDGRLIEDADPMKLFILPSQFALSVVPGQVVEIRMCRVMPLDLDADFSPKANIFANKLLKDVVIDGNIALCLRNTIWLDPVVKREYLPSLQVWTCVWSLREQLLVKGLVIANDDHMDLLRSACNGKVDLPAASSVDGSLTLSVLNEAVHGKNGNGPYCQDLNPSGSEEYIAVYVTAIESPDRFYVNRLDSFGKLQQLQEDINAHAATSGVILSRATAGCLCLARFPDDGRYYRAQVLSHRNGRVEVIFVDHGDFAEVDSEMLLEVPDNLLQLPLQAVECFLANVLSAHGEWHRDAADVMYDVTEPGGERKIMFVKLICQSAAATYFGKYRCSVDLIDTSGLSDISMCDVLVARHLAVKKCVPIEERLPHITYLRKSYDYEFQKIPELYGLFLKLTKQNDKALVVEHICQAVLEFWSYKDEMRSCGAVAALCHLAKNSEVSSPWLVSVIDCLAILAEDCRANSEEICQWQRMLPVIAAMLQNPLASSKLQEVCVRALSCFVSSESVQTKMREEGILEYLSKLLSETSSTKIQEDVCATLITFIQAHQRNCTFVGKQGLIPHIVHVLRHGPSTEKLTKLILHLFRKLARMSENQAILRDSGGVKLLCNLLFKNSGESVLADYIKTLLTLVNDDENKRLIAAEKNIESRLRELMESLGQATNIMCIRLLQALSVKVIGSSHDKSEPGPQFRVLRCPPTNKETCIQPLPKDMPPLEAPDIVHPMVEWRQTMRYIILTIKQPGVSKHKTSCSARRFRFSACVDGTTYKVDLSPLYEVIIPAKCHLRINKSDTEVALYKADQVQWPMLLQKGHKPPSAVKINFEALCNMSSDDECKAGDDSTSPFANRKKVVYEQQMFSELPIQKSEASVSDEATAYANAVPDGREEDFAIYNESSDEDELYDRFLDF